MYESALAIARLAADLISFPSLSGNEQLVCKFIKEKMTALGWKVQAMPVVADRENIFVPFGTPRVIFTTHLDVVPAPDSLFSARITDTTLYGRGACDAKGIAATMVSVAEKLLADNATDFGLLFVVGEEVDGCGAIQAAKDLAGAGIEYIINGEPTQCKLVLAHKGCIDFEMTFEGRACHSGYPELGVDANLKLVEAINILRALTFVEDPILGKSTINLGVIRGGVAANVVSPTASLRFHVRAASTAEPIIKMIEGAIGHLGDLRLLGFTEPTFMHQVPGFETDVAAYVTDIPGFAPLKAKPLLYGPGNIFHAHTDGEKVELDELLQARDGYVRIFNAL